MKKLTLAVVVASSLLSPMLAFADDVGTQLCQYIAADDKSRMRDFIKDRKLNATSVLGELKCNGKDALAFAAESKAEQTGKFMVSKLPKGHVLASMDAIKASGLPEFVDAAEKRVTD